MLRRISLVALAATAVVPVTPSHAATGHIAASGLSACATLSFPRPTTVVGEFSAVGATFGPGTITVPVAAATPIVVVNGTHWSGCAGGGYAGATVGAVAFTLVASGPDFDVVDVVDVVLCRVRSGVATCA